MGAERQAPTVRLRRLAGELRRLRRDAALTREEVNDRTGVNVATLYRIETARVRPQARTLRALLDAYGTPDGDRESLLALLKESAQRVWLNGFGASLPESYTTYIGFEAEARSVWNYESLFVPGLLQTEDYARAIIRAGLPSAGRQEVEDLVQARLRRQEVLRKDEPLHLWAIADEAALRRQVGGSAAMRAQLSTLRETADLPHVTLQIIPFSAGAHAGMQGSFTLMEFPGAAAPEVVHIDSMAGDLFLEEEADVRRYIVLFEHLRAAALSPDNSATLTAAIAGEM